MQIPILLPQTALATHPAPPHALSVENPDLFAVLFSRQLNLTTETGGEAVPAAADELSGHVVPSAAADELATLPIPFLADIPGHLPAKLKHVAPTANATLPAAPLISVMDASRPPEQAIVSTAVTLPSRPVFTATDTTLPAELAKIMATIEAGDLPTPIVTAAVQGQALAAILATIAAAVTSEGQPFQPAPHTTAAHALPAGGIPQHVSSSSWDEMLGGRVVWMIGQHHQTVELHLNPATLGPLEIKLNLSDGQANLTFATQHLPVREAIEAATPRLREMLAESGISLGSVSVNVGNFSQQAHNERVMQQPAMARRGYAAGTNMMPVQTGQFDLPRHPGMVDLYA